MISVSSDTPVESVRVSWTIDEQELHRPRANISGYRPVVWAGAYPIWFRTTTDPWIDFPWSKVRSSRSSWFVLGVSVIFEDGEETAPFASAWTLPPFCRVATTTGWTVGAAELLVTDAERRSLGLDVWADGCIGIAALRGSVYGFAANGDNGTRAAGTARWEIGPDRFIQAVTGSSISIRGETADYAAGGSVYHDERHDLLLMLYHGELIPPESPDRFWSFIGLASSDDEGRSWSSHGRIIEPQIGPDARFRPLFTEVGGAPYIVRSDQGVEYLYVYFRETLTDATSLNVSVARAPLAEVVDAAAAGVAPVFHKYLRGGWTEPGLGGASTDLMADGPDRALVRRRLDGRPRHVRDGPVGRLRW